MCVSALCCAIRVPSRGDKVLNLLKDQASSKHPQPVKVHEKYNKLPLQVVSYGRPGEQSIHEMRAEERFDRESGRRQSPQQRDHRAVYTSPFNRGAAGIEYKSANDPNDDFDDNPPTILTHDTHPNPAARLSSANSSFRPASRLSPTHNSKHHNDTSQSKINSFWSSSSSSSSSSYSSYSSSSYSSSSYGKPIRPSNEQGMKNVGNSCYSEHDTRILTDTGFLFLADIEARVAAGDCVRYACYDSAAQCIVYRPGRLVTNIPPPTHWVDFTHASTRCLWDDTSDNYGATEGAGGLHANRLTLRVTPDHNMYVQLNTSYGQPGKEWYRPSDAERDPQTLTARALAPGYSTHGRSHYRMYTGAACGLHTPENVISLTNDDLSSPVVALGLRTDDELDAFLSLFGYWLGDGTMSFDTRDGLSSADAVVFAPCKQRDRDMLQGTRHEVGLLDRLHLVRGQHYTSSETDYRLEVRITDSRWMTFFDDEFGVKYSTSGSYNRRQALLMQGMHSTQHRPSVTLSPASSSTAASSSSSSSSSDGADFFIPDEPLCCLLCGGDYLWWEAGMGCYYCPTCVEPATLTDDDDPARSAKWLPYWALFRLDARQLRLLIEGVRQADGVTAQTPQQRASAAAGRTPNMQGPLEICTSGVGFRDQLIHACLHAGYSAYFTINTRAGSSRGYNSVPKDDRIYTEEEMLEALRINPKRKFKNLISKHDNWWVCYSDSVTHVMPAHDVRFDGSPCVVPQKRAWKAGWRAVHSKSGAALEAPTQVELASLLGVNECAVRSGNSFAAGFNAGGGTWTISSLAKQQQPDPIPTQPADLYDSTRDGRVWCVTVQHDDHLIFVQRAQRDASGCVTKVGRTMISGNCYINAILQALLAQPTFTTAILHSQQPDPPPKSSLVSALATLARGRATRDVVDPRLVKDVIGRRQSRFAGYRQQDAHEFLMELLSGVTDDLVEAQVAQWRRKQMIAEGDERKEGHEESGLHETREADEAGGEMDIEIDLQSDTDRTRTPLSTLSPKSSIADTPRSTVVSSAAVGSNLDALLAATQNGQHPSPPTSAPLTPLSSAAHPTDADHIRVDGMQPLHGEEEVKSAPATPSSSSSSPIVLQRKQEHEQQDDHDGGRVMIDVSDSFVDDDDHWPNINLTTPSSAALSPPASPSANNTSPVPHHSAAPVPPSHLLKQWQQQASEQSPADHTFHLEVEVTLECANPACQYSRTNMEHFNVLSLDLPEEEVKQKKLDSYLNNNAQNGKAKEADTASHSSAATGGSIDNNSFLDFPSTSTPSTSSVTSTVPSNASTSVAPYLQHRSTSASQSSASPFTSSVHTYTRNPTTSTTTPPATKSTSNFLPSSSSSSSPSVAVPAATRPYGPRLSVRNLLANFFAPSTIECRCERCQHTHVRVTSRIARLPRVLCLHIKRFTPNWRLGTYEKRKDVVEVQQELDIAFACKSDVERPDTQRKQTAINVVCPTPVKPHVDTAADDKPVPDTLPLTPTSALSTTQLTPSRPSIATTATSSAPSSALSPSSSHALSLSTSDAVLTSLH